MLLKGQVPRRSVTCGRYDVEVCCQWSSTMEKTSVGKREEPLAGHLTGVERRGRVWGEGGGGRGGKRGVEGG